jgi:hypothetical protein
MKKPQKKRLAVGERLMDGLHAVERRRDIERARYLEMVADCELQQGHYGAAERLSHEAGRLREDVR